MTSVETQIFENHTIITNLPDTFGTFVEVVPRIPVDRTNPHKTLVFSVVRLPPTIGASIMIKS